jgi:hypothetical protein
MELDDDGRCRLSRTCSLFIAQQPTHQKADLAYRLLLLESDVSASEVCILSRLLVCTDSDVRNRVLGTIRVAWRLPKEIPAVLIENLIAGMSNGDDNFRDMCVDLLDHWAAEHPPLANVVKYIKERSQHSTSMVGGKD